MTSPYYKIFLFLPFLSPHYLRIVGEFQLYFIRFHAMEFYIDDVFLIRCHQILCGVEAVGLDTLSCALRHTINRSLTCALW
jgi:hypothetical protein